MHAVVCVKQVLDDGVALNVQQGRLLVSQPVYRMNEYDESALEQAIQLKKKVGGVVTAITVGPLISSDILAKAVAMGADRAIRIDNKGIDEDPFVKANVLAEAIRQLKEFDLVLTGYQDTDGMFSQTGILISEILGLPHISGATGFDVRVPEGKAIVRFEVGHGFNAEAEVPLPATLTIQSTVVQPRYISVYSMIEARKKIESLNLRSIIPETGASEKLSARLKVPELLQVESRRNLEMIDGKAPEVAQKICKKLKDLRLL